MRTPLVSKKSLAVALVFVSTLAWAQTRPTGPSSRQEFLTKLVAAAVERTHHTVRYDPAYVRIPYPGGDVPADKGVCTDEIIRVYRAVGVDLQKEVHEDMERNFSAYPRRWRWFSFHTDTNIDHRRVPNLMVFFSRRGESLAITERAEDYMPGELVTWDLGGNVPHIGIVVDQRSRASGRTCSSTTSGKDQRSKTYCSIGRSRDITAISGRLLYKQSTERHRPEGRS